MKSKQWQDVVFEVGTLVLVGLWISALFAVPVAVLHFTIKFW